MERPPNPTKWWERLCQREDINDLEHSGKFVVFFSILNECVAIGDKLLVFLPSLYSLDLIEHFLKLITENTSVSMRSHWKINCRRRHPMAAHLLLFCLPIFSYSFIKCSSAIRHIMRFSVCNRLFLISTRAGGLGINKCFYVPIFDQIQKFFFLKFIVI